MRLPEVQFARPAVVLQGRHQPMGHRPGNIAAQLSHAGGRVGDGT